MNEILAQAPTAIGCTTPFGQEVSTEQSATPTGRLLSTQDSTNAPTTDEFPDNVFLGQAGRLYALLTYAVGVPPAITGPMIQHAINSYANPVADMFSPNGRKGPLGLNMMISGTSGCGKTEAKNIAFGPMFQFHRDCLANTDERDRMETHVMNNATMPTILKGLAENPVANEIDDEFSSSQTGSMTRNANIRNQLYDGQTFSVDRATSGRYILHAPRFTSLILTQPHVRTTFDEKYGKRLRTMGLATRTQFSEHNGEPRALRMLPIDTAPWNAACQQMLDDYQRIRSGRGKRRAVKFSAGANRRIEALHRDYLQRGRQGGDLVMYPEHVARQTENICRIAAGNHVFEDLPGDISVDTVERAVAIGHYFTAQYIHRFSQKPTVPVVELHAAILDSRLAALVSDSRQREFELRRYVDTAPNIGLSPSQAKRAFDFLCEVGYARYFKRGNRTWIELSPERYPMIHFRC
ncbi:DUF3987 domain-containing protein [Paraburkholderia tropica]|uniref:DUF3987 domain-containing protein n=1 Tax=Paraburkholderia tropica TaxID=92647 RepID=UPI002AB71FF6|nr:DUF3987 domain-containing protein [Paraburkholderia tropica]